MSPRKTHHSSRVACIHSTIKAEHTKAKTVLDSTKIAPVLPPGLWHLCLVKTDSGFQEFCKVPVVLFHTVSQRESDLSFMPHFRKLSDVNHLGVGSQNQIRREVKRYIMLNCCRIPALRGFGQAAPSVSFCIRDRGTARHTLVKATFWVVGSAVLSARRILGSSHRSPMVQNETAGANYAASRQEYRWWRPPRRALDVRSEFGDGLFSTGRRFGASFSRES